MRRLRFTSASLVVAILAVACGGDGAGHAAPISGSTQSVQTQPRSTPRSTGADNLPFSPSSVLDGRSTIALAKEVILDGEPGKAWVLAVDQPMGMSANHESGLYFLVVTQLSNDWSVDFDSRDESGTAALWPAGIPVGDPRIDTIPNGRHGNDLVLSARVGGSAATPELAILSFGRRVSSPVQWTWGDAGDWNVKLKPSPHLVVHGLWMAVSDSGCCPTRAYDLTVSPTPSGYVSTGDDRPWLGFSMTQSASDAQPIVTDVVSDSPADGHLQTGDVITNVTGASGTTSDSLEIPRKIGYTKAGTPITLEIRRAMQAMTVRVRSRNYEDAPPAVAPGEQADSPSLGLNLDPVRGYEGPDLWVENVFPNGPAARSGIGIGDTIISVDGHPITWRDELAAYLYGAAAGSPVEIGYRNRSGDHLTMIRIPRPSNGDYTSYPVGSEQYV